MGGLVEIAADQHGSAALRAYLARLAETVLPPAERASKAKAALNLWTGYNPTSGEEAALDNELDRRLAPVQRP
ncbi:hypothetical protein ACFUJU_19715 [Streptomyces sp. NPDC057235]|uniref:hypothetical protein n=1 Tax=Streptomyces sp. NPDC057235 TaxID=3346058 RepID=UPI00363FEC4F